MPLLLGGVVLVAIITGHWGNSCHSKLMNLWTEGKIPTGYKNSCCLRGLESRVWEDEKFLKTFELQMSVSLKKNTQLLFKINTASKLQRSGGAREESAMTFDTMLDHQGICCSECQRSYTHCQRICEPLRGYWPWPYNYRGCQVACRVIMPCRWWVARILGVVWENMLHLWGNIYYFYSQTP